MKKYIILTILMTFSYAGLAWSLSFTQNSTLHQVKGNGKLTTENRSIEPFSEINTNGPFTISLTCSSKKESLDITADNNIIPLIKTLVKDSTLFIFVTKPLSSENEIKLTIAAKSINKLKVNGSTNLNASNVSTKVLTLNSEGSGDITLSGNAKDFSLLISGSGTADTEKLLTENTRLEIDGSGEATIHATKTLDIKVDGVGSVSYSGSPKSVTKDIDGIANIEKIN